MSNVATIIKENPTVTNYLRIALSASLGIVVAWLFFAPSDIYAAEIERLDTRAKQIVRVEQGGFVVEPMQDNKEVKITAIEFEELNLEDISLKATAFAALNKKFELLHRDDFIKYVAAHRELENLRADFANAVGPNSGGKQVASARKIFDFAMDEVLRREGLSRDEYYEIESVILSSPELSDRFAAVKTSFAYRADGN